jgi:hypothetical protein
VCQSVHARRSRLAQLTVIADQRRLVKVLRSGRVSAATVTELSPSHEQPPQSSDPLTFPEPGVPEADRDGTPLLLRLSVRWRGTGDGDPMVDLRRSCQSCAPQRANALARRRRANSRG